MKEEAVRVGIVALIFQDGRVLMEKRCLDEEDGNYWNFIAGGKKSEETTVEAAKREVREETGADFLPEELVGIVDHKDQRGGEDWWTVAVFEGDIEGEISENMEPEKREELSWFDLGSLPSPLHPTTEMVLDLYKSEKSHRQL